MAATLGAEFARKRRMIAGPGRRCFGTECSRRAATGPPTPSRSSRTAPCATLSPLLHLIALGTNLALLGHGWVYVVTLAAQLALLAAAALAPVVPLRAVPARPLLRRGHRGDRRRPLGLPAARGARDLGEGGGHAVRGLPRIVDVTLAGIGLALAARSCWIAAIAIKLDSRGPVIYRQRRVGKDGRQFELYKLRTMQLGADPVGVGTPVLEDDPRVTRVGRLLRRLSLDEIPNLVNVLRGEMAIVGPRPTLAAQVELYTPRQRRRLEVKPGITGWAQVNGRAGIPWEERIELDVWYVDHRSPALDLRILGRTARLLLTGHGLYG